MVKLWQKERSKPNPDQTIKKHMEEKIEAFKNVASEAKVSGKPVTHSTETQHSLTSCNSTDRLRAALRTPTPPTSLMPVEQY